MGTIKNILIIVVVLGIILLALAYFNPVIDNGESYDVGDLENPISDPILASEFDENKAFCSALGFNSPIFMGIDEDLCLSLEDSNWIGSFNLCCVNSYNDLCKSSGYDYDDLTKNQVECLQLSESLWLDNEGACCR